jgi:CMP-N-acetylneuraminic acid synthetase
MKTLAIIPARGGSKRVPRKNILDLCGKPLIAWTIEFAQSISWFDRVHVSTDCVEIAAISEKLGVKVPFFRDPKSASDTAATICVVREVIEKLRALDETYDVVAVLQPTTPWRQITRWEEARKLISESEIDSVVGATPASQHPYHMLRTNSDGLVEFFFPLSVRNLRSQDHPPAYYINGSLYLSKITNVLNENSLSGGKCAPVICCMPYESIDIDTEADFHAAQFSLPEELSQ